MKHVLMGTTALVAAGLVVGQAQAADPIKLSLGGFYGTAAGLTFNGSSTGGDDGNGSIFNHRQAGAFKQNVEIYFNGSTTLDNGLTAGVHVELEGNNKNNSSGTRYIDEVFMYFKGGFGEFRFGDTGGALGKSCVVDPGAITNNFGLISPNNSFSNVGRNAAMGLGSMGTCEDHGNATKAVYFSPVFGGFQGVISYAPSNSKTAGPATGTGSNNGIDRNIVEASLNFNKSFGAVSVTGNLAGEITFEPATSSSKPWEVQGGLVIGWGRWQFGASGEYMAQYGDWLSCGGPNGCAANPVSPDANAWFATAGMSYAVDAWTVGLEGIYGRLGTDSTDRFDVYKAVSLQATYKLGPGIRLEGEIAYFWYNGANANETNHDTDFTSTGNSASIGIGTYMTF